MHKHGFLRPGRHVAGLFGQRARMAQQRGQHPARLLVEHFVRGVVFEPDQRRAGRLDPAEPFGGDVEGHVAVMPA